MTTKEAAADIIRLIKSEIDLNSKFLYKDVDKLISNNYPNFDIELLHDYLFDNKLISKKFLSNHILITEDGIKLYNNNFL